MLEINLGLLHTFWIMDPPYIMWQSVLIIHLTNMAYCVDEYNIHYY